MAVQPGYHLTIENSSVLSKMSKHLPNQFKVFGCIHRQAQITLIGVMIHKQDIEAASFIIKVRHHMFRHIWLQLRAQARSNA